MSMIAIDENKIKGLRFFKYLFKNQVEIPNTAFNIFQLHLFKMFHGLLGDFRAALNTNYFSVGICSAEITASQAH